MPVPKRVLAVSVTTTAEYLTEDDGTDFESFEIWLHNETGSETVYWGPAGVTAATGMPILAGAYAILQTNDVEDGKYASESIFLITASGTANVRVLSNDAWN